MFKRFSLLLALCVPLSAFAADDISNSRDYKKFERFPSSYIVQYKQSQTRDYRLILGGLEKIDGSLRAEKEYLVKTTPAVSYYIELINAYNVLGQPELRDQRLQEALGIYESNKQLLYIKQRIKLRESSQVKEDKPKDQNLEE